MRTSILQPRASKYVVVPCVRRSPVCGGPLCVEWSPVCGGPLCVVVPCVCYTDCSPGNFTFGRWDQGVNLRMKGTGRKRKGRSHLLTTWRCRPRRR